jgi:hypothetical protein
MGEHPLIVEARQTVAAMSLEDRDRLARLALERPDLLSVETALALGLDRP